MRTKSSRYSEMLGGQSSVNLQAEDNVDSDLLHLTTLRKSLSERLDLPVTQAMEEPGNLRAKGFSTR